MKKKCLIYGNCQTQALHKLLIKNSQFNEQFEATQVSVHRISEPEVGELESYAGQADVFIYQPVNESYRQMPKLSTKYLASLMRPESILISIPVAFFTAYNHELFRLRDTHNATVTEPFRLHDVNIIAQYIQGKTVEKTLQLIQDPEFYTADAVNDILTLTLNNMEKRENVLGIKGLTNFIRKNFRKDWLFYVNSHPSNAVISFVVKKILDQLEISDDSSLKRFFSKKNKKELLHAIHFPIYPSTARHLKLKFDLPREYHHHVQSYTWEEGIKMYFEFYDSHPDIVEVHQKTL